MDGALLHGPCPRTHVLVRHERHGRDAVGPVAVLAAPLKDRSDVFGKRHVVGDVDRFGFQRHDRRNQQRRPSTIAQPIVFAHPITHTPGHLQPRETTRTAMIMDSLESTPCTGCRQRLSKYEDRVPMVPCGNPIRHALKSLDRDGAIIANCFVVDCRARHMSITRGLVILLLLLMALPGSAQPRPGTIRVFTYNIHHGEGTDGDFDFERLANIIKGTDADLGGAAGSGSGHATSRRRQRDHRARSADRHAWRIWQGDRFPGRRRTASASFRDGPLSTPRTTRCPELPDREPRTALTVEVKTGNGVRLQFTSTHLDQGREVENRLAQATEINQPARAVNGISRRFWPET